MLSLHVLESPSAPYAFGTQNEIDAFIENDEESRSIHLSKI